VTASITDKETVLVGSQFLKIIACGAVGAPQDKDRIGHGETPPFLPLGRELYDEAHDFACEGKTSSPGTAQGSGEPLWPAPGANKANWREAMRPGGVANATSK